MSPCMLRHDISRCFIIIIIITDVSKSVSQYIYMARPRDHVSNALALRDVCQQ